MCCVVLCCVFDLVCIYVTYSAIRRSNCFHKNGDDAPCYVSNNPYMILFGIMEILLSQIPNFSKLWWLSILAAVMSFSYSSIGLGLGIAKALGKEKKQTKERNRRTFGFFVLFTLTVFFFFSFEHIV